MNTDGKAPWDFTNVVFLEKGEWFMVAIGTEKLFVKVSEENAAKLISGAAVPAHHVMTASLKNPLYLSVMTGTVEPWFIVGNLCSLIAKVHPIQGEIMDAEVKRLIAGEEKAKLVVPDKRILRVD